MLTYADACRRMLTYAQDESKNPDARLILPVIVFSCFSTLLFGALARLLVPYKVLKASYIRSLRPHALVA